jgi:putative membrane protein
MTERRPDRSLLTYYILTSFLLGPLFPVLLIPLYFKYHTLRYVFDDQGISMSWGIIFRREISLTYARIQDIHLSSNIVERWLGLARVQVQTASGSAEAEMTIEGLKDFEPIRDFLYSRMRGIAETPSQQATVAPVLSDDEDLGQLLHTIAQEVRALRLSLEGRDKIDS